MRSIYVQVVQHSPEHRLLARFLPRPPGARRFRSFDKVGRPWLLRTTLMLLLGLLLPLPLILLFVLRLLLPRHQFVCGWSCALISLVISCVHSHARGEITASGNFSYMQTLVASERFLIDDRGGHLYEYTFSTLGQDLRFGHVLDRAT